MSINENATTNPPQPYIDLSRVPLPTKVKIDNQELEVSQLSDKQRAVLVDLARIDKELADAEFSVRVLKAAKAELSRLLVSKPPSN